MWEGGMRRRQKLTGKVIGDRIRVKMRVRVWGDGVEYLALATEDAVDLVDDEELRFSIAREHILILEDVQYSVWME